MQRRPVVLLRGREVGAELHQLDDGLGVSVHGSVVERRPLASPRSVVLNIRLGVDVGAELHELRARRGVAVERRVMERRPLVLVLAVDVGAELDKLRDGVGVSGERSALQRLRVALVRVRKVYVRALAHRGSDALYAARLRRLPQLLLHQDAVHVCRRCAASETKRVKGILNHLSLHGLRLVLGVSCRHHHAASLPAAFGLREFHLAVAQSRRVPAVQSHTMESKPLRG
mmetsp:Transcript_47923/g.113437  ORF Transcript_47923/g.113437 Transcript_47923/m.113437 type:complete len:229 (+) Transcript_47923:678-1364(+)